MRRALATAAAATTTTSAAATPAGAAEGGYVPEAYDAVSSCSDKGRCVRGGGEFDFDTASFLISSPGFTEQDHED